MHYGYVKWEKVRKNEVFWHFFILMSMQWTMNFCKLLFIIALTNTYKYHLHYVLILCSLSGENWLWSQKFSIFSEFFLLNVEFDPLSMDGPNILFFVFVNFGMSYRLMQKRKKKIHQENIEKWSWRGSSRGTQKFKNL